MNTSSYLDFGRSRLNFATISVKAFLGSRNLSIPRRSISRLRKKDCTNFRAAASERFSYIRVVIALGTDASASECRTGGRVSVLGWRTSQRYVSFPFVYGSVRTVRCHRIRGVAPISCATLAQDIGPTCALTAAFKTRVGRYGYDACRCSVANRPINAFPTVASCAFDARLLRG